MSSKNPEGPRLESQPADAFGTIDELDCRGRRVFLRLDPYVVETLPRRSRTREKLPAAEAAVPEGVRADEPMAKPSSLERLLALEARVVIGTHVTREAGRETGLSNVEAVASQL